MPENYKPRLNGFRTALGGIVIRSVLSSRYWRLLPAGHPTRIFFDGRVDTWEPVVRATVRPHRTSEIAWGIAAIALIVLTLMVMHALAHTFHINVLEGLFDKGAEPLPRI